MLLYIYHRCRVEGISLLLYFERAYEAEFHRKDDLTADVNRFQYDQLVPEYVRRYAHKEVGIDSK